MKKFQRFLKKSAAALMVLVTAAAAIPTAAVFAASERAAIKFEYCHDGAGNAIRYQQTLTYEGRECGAAGETGTRIYADGENAYCIQAGVSLHTGNTLQANASDAWNALSADQKNAVKLALLYGAQGSPSELAGTEDEKVLATQLIVWELTTGARNAAAPYGRNDSRFYDGLCAGGANGGVATVYNQIAGRMEAHGTIPGFASGDQNSAAQELEWDGEKYVLEVEDTNGVLSLFDFVSPDSRVKVSVSGNRLTVTSDTALKDEVCLSAAKKVPAVSSSAKLVAYGDPVLQDVVTGVENAEEVKAYLNVKTSYGQIRIVKTSEDGVIKGVRFHIVGEGVDQTGVTGEDGTMKVENLKPGIYTVTEITEERYETQEAQTVTVMGGQTAQAVFSNVLKRGSLKVTKTSEDGFVENVRFHLTGTSLSGEKVDVYASTDKNGVAVFSGLPVSGAEPYILEEAGPAVRYVVPAAQEVTVRWNEVTHVTETNILKKFRVNVVKTDTETGRPQGDGSLAGAVYGVYDGENLVDTYTTDGNGRFTTKYYPCGDHWSVREITPPEGYLLDGTAYHVGAEAGNYTVERNTVSLPVAEQVIKGRISIIKHTDDGSTQIETPETGAEFQVYRKSSGSYAQAKESERDTLVCDASGYAETKDLPYGVYTVHQTGGWEGREKIGDFDVYIGKDGEVYRFLINNAWFESYIKVVKKDAETGKIIPLAGAGFQIYDGAGELVTMKHTYPEMSVLDTFYTGAGGYLLTPEALPCGDYQLVEVQAPYGYVLDKTPVPFTVSEDKAAEENGLALVVVEMEDVAQKARITVTKTGEEFAGVQVSGEEAKDKNGTAAEVGKRYTPVYRVTGKEGAVYEIIAMEDIVTPDGTVRAKAGEVADTVTTGPDGSAVSGELYLGKYGIVEKTAPEGLLREAAVYETELVYAGQELTVTDTGAHFYNERQKVSVKLEKAWEQDEIFGLGNQGEIREAAFGLYAAEDLTAADGSVIPEDGLIEIRSCDPEGRAAFTSDLPFGTYYVKEVSAGRHYILSGRKYPVEFSYQGQDTEVVKISVNQGNVIENKLIRGKISGRKADTEGEPLEGAVIGLFAMGTEEFTKETALLVSVSDKGGAFAFDDVPYGDYIVREIASPAGYVLNEELHYVSVTFPEEVIEVKVINRRITGSVRLTKVDAEYPAGKLTGAVFELYRDADGNQEFDAGSDTLIGEIPETSEGIYQKDGLVYGGYFVKEKSAPEGFVLDGQAYFFYINQDGRIVEVENEAGVGFVNRPVTGELEITKRDIADGKELPDAGFRIKDEDGNIVAVGRTGQDGVAAFPLRYGKYTYQEYDAPEGYRIDETEYPFEIKEDGQVVKAVMTNEREPEETLTTPRTGDDSPVGLLVFSFVAAVGVAVSATLAGRYGKKKGEKQER